MHMNLKPNKHKIISFNTTTIASLGFVIVVTTIPPLLKGGGVGRGTKSFAGKGDKPVKGGGLM